MDAVTSSSRTSLDVWARWVLCSWVSDGMFGDTVSLRGPISCLALGGPFWGTLGVPSGLHPEEVRGRS